MSIATLTGDSGLLTKAQEAKNIYLKKSFNEKIQIAITPYIISNDFILEDRDMTSIMNELNSYGNIETKKIAAYEGKIDLEIKDINGNICLLTNRGDIVEKVEGNKEDWEILEETRGETKINKYIGEDVEELVIPNYIDGKWIQKTCGKHATNSIMDGYNIKNVTISEGIKCIDTSSFFAITSIETVKLPETLEIIGWGAFLNCSKLKKINFPNSLKSIGQLSFDSCISLPIEIILEEKIEKIGTYAFANSSVKNVKINRKKGSVIIDPRTVF